MKSTIAFDKFQGIKQRNAIVDYANGTISALECVNCELYNTELGSNIGVRTISGRNKTGLQLPDGFTILGDFTTKQDNKEFRILYGENDTKGSLFLVTNNEPSIIIDNLTKTGTCNGLDIAQGFYDYFVFTNGEEIYTWCNGQDEKVKQINAVSTDGTQIKGLPLAVHNQRLVIGSKNRVYWSKQLDIFDFSAFETGVTTNAHFEEFTNNITAISSYIEGIIAFTDKDSTFMSGNPADVSSFTRQDCSIGGTPCFSSVVIHDKYLFYYDRYQHNIYYFLQNDIGQKRTGEAIAFEIQNYLTDLDFYRVNEIKMYSVYANSKNEIWLLLPIKDGQRLLIFDYYTQQWIERTTNGINAINIFENELYTSENNSVYLENLGSFNGTCSYKLNIINMGSDTNLKIPKLVPTVTVDFNRDNVFWVEIRVDGKAKVKQKLIQSDFKKYGSWGDDTDVSTSKEQWNTMEFLPSREIPMVAKLPPIPAFKWLELRFFTKEIGQNFGIKRFELKKIREKTKTL